MKKSGIIVLAAGSLVIAAGALVIAAGALQAKPLTYKLPEETAQLKPGPNLEVAQANCMACHSVDYIQTQPRGPKFQSDFWTATVNKMIKVYGAPIEDADVPKIVEYLTATH